MDQAFIIFITLLFSAFFSGLEIAFISANKLKIEVDRNKGLLSGKVLSDLMRTPSRFIGAMLLGNNVMMVIYGIAMAGLLEPALENVLPGSMNTPFWIMSVQTILSTLLILIAAEFLPKTLFRINPNGILNILALPAYFFHYLFYPVVYLFTGLSEKILQNIFHVKFVRTDYTFTTVDLDNYVKEYSYVSKDDGEMDPEIQMFQNAIDFRLVKLRECMVPRTEITAMEDQESIEKVKDLIISSGHSKILIYNNSIDNIIGYAHSYDLFRNPSSIQEILKPILIAPESMPANRALALLIAQRKSIAVVVDEFGGTSGIVTMEDIIEEIFGEIRDEFDHDEELERQIGRNEYIFSGRLEIDYLNEKYKLDLPVSEDYETLAGLILYHHESIPECNDEIIVDPVIFTILQASEIRVEQVQLKINT